MTSATTGLKVVLYNADKWEHVCPQIRVIRPCEEAGLDLVAGGDWQNHDVRSDPERVTGADLVVMQRNFPANLAEYDRVISLAHAQNTPVVYDLDDLLWGLSEEHPDGHVYDGSRMAMLHALAEADAVTCSTEPLAAYLRQFQTNVTVLPNYLDDRLWAAGLARALAAPAGDFDRDRPLVIGYMGGHSHLPDLEAIQPVLVKLLQRYGPTIRLRFWGVEPPSGLAGHPLVECLIPGLVSYAEFAAYFSRQDCDIFIAPLADNFFNRCKSPLKFLEYSALGIPGVYSRESPYGEVVADGVTGLLAGAAEEWLSAIGRLIEEPDLRLSVGRNARQAVMDHWLLSCHAHRWAEFYGQVEPRAATGAHEELVRFTSQARAWQAQTYRDLRQTDAALGRTSEDLASERAAHTQDVTTLHAVLQSPGWQFVEKVGAVRHRLIPYNSTRERVASLGVQAMLAWRQEGFRSALRKAMRRSALPSAGSEFFDPQTRRSLSLAITPGAGVPGEPVRLTVVIIRGAGQATFTPEQVLAWAGRQTYAAVDTVIWDRTAARASLALDPERTWPAPDVVGLVAGLAGRYVCFASWDLLAGSPTFLEENVLVLETEELALAINVDGNSAGINARLAHGRLPGDQSAPFAGIVLRKECLGLAPGLDADPAGQPEPCGMAFDLSAWVRLHALGSGRVVGKIITHTTNRSPVRSDPAEIAVLGGSLHSLASYLVADAAGLPPAPESGVHEVHPIETVLPVGAIADSRPTVLVVMPFLAVGGAERVALDMMRCLQKDIRFVVIATDAYDAAQGTTADAFREITPYVYTMPDYLAAPLTLSFVLRQIERFAAQTYYIANGSPWIYDSLAKIRDHFPGLRTVNQVYDHQAGWINRYDAALVANLDGHIGVNAKICQAFRQRGVPAEKIHLLENGVDADEFDLARYSEEQRRAIRQRLGLPEGGKIVTFIGRLHQQKRPMDYVEMARRFVNEPAVSFLMVGDGPLATPVDLEIHRIGLKNLIRRPFYRPSSDIYAITDVIVLPSEYEGMPMVILEALAMGKAAVVTDVGNNREVLTATGGGTVVARVGDIDGLASALSRILSAPPDPIGVRQAILSQYTLAQMAEKYRRCLLGA